MQNSLPAETVKFSFAHASADAERQTSDHAVFEGWCRFFPTGGFRFKTGVTSRDPKAVEPVDDQEEESMMCWLQYVLPQFWARLALVTPMYPPPFFRTR